MSDTHKDPILRQGIAGAQMLFVAFGALVLMPLLTGMDPNVALFTAGIGTLLFQLVTRREVPVFLASSFAFIAPIMAIKGEVGLPAVLGGIIAAGVVYILMSLAVKLRGAGFIDRLLPPVVIAPVIISIGLALSPVAVGMAMGGSGDNAISYTTAIIISMSSLVATLLVATLGRGLFRLVPILAGIVVGCALSAAFGIIDTSGIAAAPWLALPNFVAPEFHWGAILYMLPVALAPAIEHIGGVVAIGSVTGKNFIQKPGLHRTLLGDGLATSAAGFFGGPPNTTYAEVTGAVMLTKNYNPKVMTWAAVFAILMAFVGKFGAALQSIPAPVMGGILCLLFGSIAVVGLNTLIRNQVDLSQPRNLIIVSVTLVFGIGGMKLGTPAFALSGISLAALTALLLNLLLPGGQGWKGKALDQA
ncbi:MAG TPA: uracil-xanthine permease family protein [Pseudomonas sp.]|uniref:uracil-xanthine permease family protein n=1 Tax=Pseudomonas sp. TaxID=306 RepID=UPI002D1D5505|nr:uracil-xanthine permease family protein [Pseudomonas sp.]HTO18363.1 uracil-xanthine permease family protein [Pseudomonas sp.]